MAMFNRRAEGLKQRKNESLRRVVYRKAGCAGRRSRRDLSTSSSTLITNGKGTVDKVDKWGTRKLAYRVSKYDEGHLHADSIHRHAGPGEGNRAPHARHRHGDQVHHRAHRREAKKIEKSKKAREKRAARRPAPHGGSGGSALLRLLPAERLRGCAGALPVPPAAPEHPGVAAPEQLPG